MALVSFFLGVFGAILVYKHIDNDAFETIVGVMMLIIGFVIAALIVASI